MKRLILSISVVPALLLCSVVAAQDPDGTVEPAVGEQNVALDQLQVPETTQDMWFYLQELRRYDDPHVMIRRKEEKKAEQRRLRLAAQKWFGMLPGRPTANPTPYTGSYSPMWVGNGYDPYHWVGSGTITAIRIQETVNR
jgi:hypothetical protein